MAPLDDFFDHSASAPDARVIAVRGAREHNLKNVDLDIPRDRLVVFTGLSGSGKSSLAFDTIYAEGQRRYVESLSAYARQFLEMMQKPDVDQIDGLSPAISIEQKTTSQQPALDGRHGHRDLRLHAPALGAGRHPLLARDRPADREPDVSQMVDRVLALPERHAALPARARGARPQGRVPQGDRRVPEEGLSARSRSTANSTRSTRPRRSTRSSSTTSTWWWTASWCAPTSRARLAESFETALELADGIAVVEFADAPRGKRRLPARRKTRRAPYRLRREIRLPGLRLHHSRDRAAAVLLQQPVRRLPDCGGLGARDAGRRRAHRAGRDRHA